MDVAGGSQALHTSYSYSEREIILIFVVIAFLHNCCNNFQEDDKDIIKILSLSPLSLKMEEKCYCKEKEEFYDNGNVNEPHIFLQRTKCIQATVLSIAVSISARGYFQGCVSVLRHFIPLRIHFPRTSKYLHAYLQHSLDYLVIYNIKIIYSSLWVPKRGLFFCFIAKCAHSSLRFSCFS